MKLAITVGAVLVVAAIVIGALQVQDEFAVDESANLALSPPAATATPSALAGSALIFEVRGGDDPCRYLYANNHIGTFAGGEIALEFIAAPQHEFTIRDADGISIGEIHMGRSTTVQTMLLFKEVGLYRLYDAAFSGPGHVAEIFARPIGQAAYVPVTGWCDS